MKKLLLLFSAIMLAVSCVSTKNLKKSMVRKPGSFSYLMDSKPIEKKKNISIQVLPVLGKDSLLQLYSELERTHTSFLPLIFYYRTTCTFRYDIGSETLREDPENFLSKAFTEEAKRSGKYYFTGDTGAADYTLLLELDSISAGGTYQWKEERFVLPLINSPVSISAFARNSLGNKAYASIKYSLFDRNGSLVKADFVETITDIPPLKDLGVYSSLHYKSSYNAEIIYNASLTEGIGLCLKKNIEQIVHKINSDPDLLSLNN